MRSHRPGLFATLAIAGLAGCGGRGPDVIHGAIVNSPGATPRVALAGAFWIPGERMWFHTSMHGLHVADMVVAVGEPGIVEGKRAITVHGRASTAGVLELFTGEVSEEAIVQIDVATGTPIDRDDTEAEGATVRGYHSVYSDGQVAFTATIDGEPGGAWDEDTPPGRALYDNYSLVGLLREWRPARGEVADFYAVTDRMLDWHVVRYSGLDDVTVLGAPMQANRYDVDIYEATADHVGDKRADQSYTIWIADDASRAPVKIAAPHRLGRLVYELTDYRAQ